MNLRSSRTPRLVGSAIATVSVRPSRLSGRTRCFVRQVGRDQLRDLRIDLETREVDRRHPVLAREHARQLDFLDEAELDEVVADARAVLFLLLKRAVQLLARDQPLAKEEITNALTRGLSCWCCGHVSRRGNSARGASATPPGRVSLKRQSYYCDGGGRLRRLSLRRGAAPSRSFSRD